MPQFGIRGGPGGACLTAAKVGAQQKQQTVLTVHCNISCKWLEPVLLLEPCASSAERGTIVIVMRCDNDYITGFLAAVVDVGVGMRLKSRILAAPPPEVPIAAL